MMDLVGMRLSIKLAVLVVGGLLLFVEAMIYSGAELWEYLAYLFLHFLFLCCLAGALFLPRKPQIWFGGGMVLFALASWVAEERLPSIRREFVKMSCADIDLVYDETKGICAARAD